MLIISRGSPGGTLEEIRLPEFVDAHIPLNPERTIRRGPLNEGSGE
ncbi:hypothetical protein [Methanofollis sp. W23]|nr:hypothetical protein [Methanofollis sp. W23]